MSYCHFDIDCDLEVYPTMMGGYSIEIASERYESFRPKPQSVQDATFDLLVAEPIPEVQEFVSHLTEVKRRASEWKASARKVRIHKRYAGTTIRLTTTLAVVEKVKELRWLGYQVPIDLEFRILKNPVRTDLAA